MSELPLLGQMLVQSIGPLIAIVGGSIAVNCVAKRYQERKDRLQMRIHLATEVVETANTLYLATQNFWRETVNTKTSLSLRLTSTDLAPHLQTMRDAYGTARLRGAVIEEELRTYFVSPLPAQKWHETMNRLTVRYQLLVVSEGQQRRRIRSQYASHTGLTDEQMKVPGTLIRECRNGITATSRAIWQYPINLGGTHLQSSSTQEEEPEDFWI